MSSASDREALHRPAVKSDSREIIDLINAYTRHHYGADRLGEHELDGGFNETGKLRRHNMEAWRDSDGGLQAFAGFWRCQWPARWDLWLDVTVRPEARDRARLWDAVLGWSEGHARAMAESADSKAGILCGSRVLGSDETALSVYRSRGFEHTMTETLMQTELIGASLQAPRWPDGVVCRTLNLDTDLERYAVGLDESFQEEGGYIPLSPEEAVAARRDEFKSFGDEYVPELWFVAVDGHEIVGGVGSFPSCGGNRERSYLYHVFVRPAWRGRGIATALLRTSFQAVRRRGCRFAELHVNSRNSTGALDLYRAVGMEPVWHQDLYEKAVPIV